MSFELVLDFSANGQVEGMHMDKFDLGFLGKQTITRATEIVFNEDTQLWGLFLPKFPGDWQIVRAGQGFTTYETARQFEVAWLNVCRVKDIDPASEDGEQVMKRIRYFAGFNRGVPPTVQEYESITR